MSAKLEAKETIEVAMVHIEAAPTGATSSPPRAHVVEIEPTSTQRDQRKMQIELCEPPATTGLQRFDSNPLDQSPLLDQVPSLGYPSLLSSSSISNAGTVPSISISSQRRESLLRFKRLGTMVISGLDRKPKAPSRQSMLLKGFTSAAKSAQSVQIAAILVKNSQNGIFDQNWFVRSEGWLKLHHLYSHPLFRFLRVSMFIAFMALSFFEEPVWCRVADRAEMFHNSYDNYANINQTFSMRQGSYFGGGLEGSGSTDQVTPETNPTPASIDDMPRCGSDKVYIHSGVQPLPITVSLICELLLLVGLLITEVLLKFKFLGFRMELRRDKSLGFMTVFFLLSILDVLLSFAFIQEQTWRFSPLFRPILFLAMQPSVRARALDLLKGLPAIVEVLALLAVLILIYSWCTLVLFIPANSQQGRESFEDLQESLWNLQVQLTTANFPDIMLPAWRVSRFWMLFFVSLFILGTYFLMPLILANIFNGYSRQHAESIKQFQLRKIQGLHDAFLLLDFEKTGEIKFQVIMELLFEMLGIQNELHAPVATAAIPASSATKSAAGTSSPAAAQVTLLPTIDEASPKSNDNQAAVRGAPLATESDKSNSSHMTPKLLRLGGEAEHQHGPPAHLDAHSQAAWMKAKLYFDALDNNRGGTIDQKEFESLCTILTLNLHTLSPPILPASWKIWSNPRFMRFTTFIQRKWKWNLIMFLIIIINCIGTIIETTYFRSSPIQTGAGIMFESHCINDAGVAKRAVMIQHALALNILQLCCVAIYVLDVTFKIFTIGWAGYLRAPGLVFEGIFTLFAMASELLLLLPRLACSEDIYALVLVLRILRTVRLLAHITRFQIILATYLKLLPRFAVIVGMLIAVYFFFAHLGLMLYGGKIYFGDPRLLRTQYFDTSQYYEINFNDFGSAMSALFILMVVSNWQYIVEGFVMSTSRWSRIFFLVFYYVAVLMVLSLCTAFILDTFITEWTRASEENKRRVKSKKRERRASIAISKAEKREKRTRRGGGGGSGDSASAGGHLRSESDSQREPSSKGNASLNRMGSTMLLGLHAQHAKAQKFDQLQKGKRGSLYRMGTDEEKGAGRKGILVELDEQDSPVKGSNAKASLANTPPPAVTPDALPGSSPGDSYNAPTLANGGPFLSSNPSNSDANGLLSTPVLAPSLDGSTPSLQTRSHSRVDFEDEKHINDFPVALQLEIDPAEVMGDTIEDSGLMISMLPDDQPAADPTMEELASPSQVEPAAAEVVVVSDGTLPSTGALPLAQSVPLPSKPVRPVIASSRGRVHIHPPKVVRAIPMPIATAIVEFETPRLTLARSASAEAAEAASESTQQTTELNE